MTLIHEFIGSIPMVARIEVLLTVICLFIGLIAIASSLLWRSGE